ncbi:unnamed protein product [Pseudo-nitzschia multistriata]|uniref:HTH myb-type domain-containing protein n=1 Tax=Pseudo-nitzschia multistriata TaxID=183589 RepID=A0A448ZGM3_9STRA|nr:unnamed protein product [Pseudo-nitzschia multistriata]
MASVKRFGGGDVKWPQIAVQINKAFHVTRNGKQCRERWLNHLRPNIKKGKWTGHEEGMIEYFYNNFGPKWSTMSKLMKNRTDNDIKNKWNSMKRARERKKAEVSSAIMTDNDEASRRIVMREIRTNTQSKIGKMPPKSLERALTSENINGGDRTENLPVLADCVNEVFEI